MNLVQDVFTTLIQVLPTFIYDEHKSFRSWLLPHPALPTLPIVSPHLIRLAELFSIADLSPIPERHPDQLRPIGVAEVRHWLCALFQSFEKIGDLMYESVFVTDLQAGNPPLVHVGVLGDAVLIDAIVADMHRFPCPQPGIAFLVIEYLQAMKIVQVPEERSVFAVDLERVSALWPRA